MQALSESANPEGPTAKIHLPSLTGDGVFVAGSLIAGRYRLDEVIGRGGMATVWRGHDERLARDVAIKLCPPAMLHDGSRNLREAHLSSALLHPNIVTIFDAGDIASFGSFIVMEFIDGTTAHQIAPVEWRTAVDIVRQASVGLAAAHERGIVHCDVKPGNLLVDRRNRVLVADFGIAMPAESESGDFVHGSPAYIAPERLTGVPADPRVDVYGLGGVLAFLMTAQSPERQAVGLPPDCPDEVASVITRARARNPDERFPDARAFRIALDNATKDGAQARPADVPTINLGSRSNRPAEIGPSRRQRSHATRSRTAQTHSIVQRRVVRSSAPVRLGGQHTSVQRVRTAFRPTPAHRTGTRVVLGTIGLLLLLAGGIILRPLFANETVAPGPPSAIAAIEMPNVQGQTFGDAIQTLSDLDIVVERIDVIYGPGPNNQVVAQHPSPGDSIDNDDPVTLVIRTTRYR